MLRNYLKVALRNLLKNKVYSFINIGGLAVGMAVAILIGLWIWDEITYNTYHQNYERIVQVMQHNLYNGKRETQTSNPYVMAEEIRSKYGSSFTYVLQSSWTSGHVLTYGEKKATKTGNYFEPQVTEMLSLHMLKGTRTGLKEPHSILLSESIAQIYFGNEDPIGKIMRIDNNTDVKVTGVYEDLPYNSDFREMTYILPWELYLIMNPWIKKMEDPWDSNFTQTFAQMAANTDIEKVSAQIKNVKFNRVSSFDRKYKPEVFLHPMTKWRLYSDWKDGVNAGGRIENVWLFSIIGIFVLLLACINFMNLATARSEKRAKEVGIRKTVGSIRGQLIAQFFSESLLVVMFGFLTAIFLVQLSLPFFNEVADKKMSVPYLSPVFWLLGLSFSVVTGLIAGSYPALYLSSFQPVKVLKGTFRVGRYAALPRRILVVMQFAVSVTLIIGTIVVFRQIQHAKDRPIGYDRNGLISMLLTTPDIHNHLEAVRNELKSSGAIVDMTESTSPTTSVWNTNGGFDWKGKDPELAVDFPNNGVTHDYGKTVGWQFKEGRDFSREYATDSMAFVINEAAVKFLGFEHPIGETVKWNNKPYTIVGVIKNMVVQSPYQPIRAAFFHISKEQESVVIIKLNPKLSARDALSKVEAVFKKYSPATPFEYKFVDEEYAQKFGDEERIGTLAAVFAGLAILISCLGIFGLSSFVAEQRTKEIGIRKVLGASVLNLWSLLSKDFVRLVFVSFLFAIPTAWYFMNQWLQKYEYRTTISWWVFVVTGLGALLITLLTISFQSLKAAFANPVKSLRSE
ncbi:ABC transporter permease [Cytophagaceae bacterium DM2B3-1]|uniref:ABC transporter permease n=1 Tax=Xanthocytophaga flava TaxID=3048013 RepID=A0ABT7CFJ1_9BACT|nr:ABC transporter permease [Xanthocytophaga flavus]MDJ1491842.1 ABC transporter permease [Xanthocytophaga flavus]